MKQEIKILFSKNTKVFMMYLSFYYLNVNRSGRGVTLLLIR